MEEGVIRQERQELFQHCNSNNDGSNLTEDNITLILSIRPF